MKRLIIFVAILTSLHTTGQIFATGHLSSPMFINIDCGGNGSGDGSGFADVGEMTPSNSSRVGYYSATGTWWNNITNGFPGTLLSDPRNTSGAIVTGFSISIDKVPRGSFSTIDSSMNFQGYVGALGEFPATVTIDNMYFHSSANPVTMTFVIPGGYSADVTFWGSRTTTGINRTLQIKKGTDGSYTLSYNALNNSNTATAVTLTGLTGTSDVNFQVAAGLTFGHVSYIIVKLTKT